MFYGVIMKLFYELALVFVITIFRLQFLYGLADISNRTNLQNLEQFFWSGSGDGAPPPADKPVPTPVHNVVTKTTTVLATLYMDNSLGYIDESSSESTWTENEAFPDGLHPDIEGTFDKKYWLLTIIRGVTPDMLQVKLARLYQKAFLRQQEMHLGLVKALDDDYIINRRKHATLIETTSINTIELQTSMQTYNNYDYLHETYNLNRDSVDDNNTFVSNKTLINATRLNSNNESNNLTLTEHHITNKGIYIDKNSITKVINGTKFPYQNNTTIISQGKENFSVNIASETFIANSTQLVATYDNTSDYVFHSKREVIKPEEQPPVKVIIQNVTQLGEDVELVYVVCINGRAVPAKVAADDMSLVGDTEVSDELNSIVVTKAEPYIKLESNNSSMRGSQDKEVLLTPGLWAVISGVLAALLLILFVMLLMCRIVTKKKTLSASSLNTYRNELLRAVEETHHKHMKQENEERMIGLVSSARTRPSSSKLPVYRRSSSTSSTSSGSGLSEIASALRKRHKKIQKSRSRRVGDSFGSNNIDTASPIIPETPTSFLSMPSVKSFPRTIAVEPLSKVLQPISVKHLDIDTPVHSRVADQPVFNRGVLQNRLNITEAKNVDIPRRQMSSQLIRLGSDGKDPGVIGPLVWNLHYKGKGKS